MSKGAADRPQSFTDIVGILEGHINSLSGATVVHATPAGLRQQQPATVSADVATPAPMVKPRTPLVWYIAAGVTLLFAAAAVFFVIRARSGPGTLPATISSPAGDMTLVSAGDFLYGPEGQKMSLKAFYIDKTEVTNAAWADFCKATSCTAPPGDPSFPIADISISQAREFARWAGKRLPTTEEWEKAARGTDGRKYPWGNDEKQQDADIGTGTAVAVTTHPEGASPYGALQMAGNVAEIVSTIAHPTPELVNEFSKAVTPPPTEYEPWVIIRGGSFRKKSLSAALTYEYSRIPARFTRDDIGFRCAKDPPNQ
jgi:serine/threonine-protein kinase